MSRIHRPKNPEYTHNLFIAMFFAKTPPLIRVLMPSCTWSVATGEPVLYLTFDDGPIPVVTPWVLDTLRPFGAKATFFCVGDNVVKHPAIYRQILEEGHAVGNHTFHHLNGWQTGHAAYLNDVRRCARAVKSRLFRPPYGRLLPRQYTFLRRHFRIIMWDVLSGDYNAGFAPQQCLRHVLGNARPGSIVLLHDSLKAERNLRYTLPATLEHFAKQGYRFEAVDDEWGNDERRSGGG